VSLFLSEKHRYTREADRIGPINAFLSAAYAPDLLRQKTENRELLELCVCFFASGVCAERADLQKTVRWVSGSERRPVIRFPVSG
jgi:hypothetical protein